MKLTSEEKELIIAAKEIGVFYLVSVDQTGTWVRAGEKDFVDHNDPAFAATYREAFESLCEHGYIKKESTNYFVLTGSGFEKARELAEEEQ